MSSPGLRPSSTQWLKIDLNLLSTTQHAHGGVETAWRNHHLSAAHQLPIPGEEHLHNQVRVVSRQLLGGRCNTIPNISLQTKTQRSKEMSRSIHHWSDWSVRITAGNLQRTRQGKRRLSYWATYRNSLRCFSQVLELLTAQKQHWLKFLLTSELQMVDWLILLQRLEYLTGVKQVQVIFNQIDSSS